MYSVQVKFIDRIPKLWLYEEGVTKAVGHPMNGFPLLGKIFKIPPGELKLLEENAKRQVEEHRAHALAVFHAMCPKQSSPRAN